GSRQRGVKREGDAAGEANLPPMRMPAQQQIESSTRGLPEEAGHCLLAHIRMQIAQMQDPEAVKGFWSTVRDNFVLPQPKLGGISPSPPVEPRQPKDSLDESAGKEQI